jgi:hypothetical protein
MQKVFSYIRQPTTLAGISVLVYLGLKHFVPVSAPTDIPIIAAALVMIVTPDSSASAGRVAQLATQVEQLGQGAPPAP